MTGLTNLPADRCDKMLDKQKAHDKSNNRGAFDRLM